MKKRLDIILFEKGCYDSRERSKAAIMAGLIFVEGELKDKPGEKIEETSDIKIKGNPIPYVSRGGLKLEKAFNVFPFHVKDREVIDIGASTGGFTDCLLQNGARKVYSIDVGYGQLAWKLRQDPRVVTMERTNFRYVKLKEIGKKVSRATIDVSFISLSIIMKNLFDLMDDDGQVVALIKPQFEAGKDKVGKKGVVSQPQTHIDVVKKVIDKINTIGFSVLDLSYSPVTGPKGNIEFLAFISKDTTKESSLSEDEIIRIVNEAHNNLR